MSPSEAAEIVLEGEKWCWCIVCNGKGHTRMIEGKAVGKCADGFVREEPIRLPVPCVQCGGSGQELHGLYREALIVSGLPLPAPKPSKGSRANVTTLITVREVRFPIGEEPNFKFQVFSRDTTYSAGNAPQAPNLVRR